MQETFFPFLSQFEIGKQFMQDAQMKISFLRITCQIGRSYAIIFLKAAE